MTQIKLTAQEAEKLGLAHVKKSKYRNVREEVDGIVFASRKEARHYRDLKIAQSTGVLKFFLRQVPIHLEGGTKYVVDFLEFWGNRDVIFRDAKGFRTPMYRLKKRQVEARYPIKIIEV